MTIDLRLAIPAIAGWVASGIVVGLPGFAVPVLVIAWLGAGVCVFVNPRVAIAAAAIALCCTSIAIRRRVVSHQFWRMPRLTTAT